MGTVEWVLVCRLLLLGGIYLQCLRRNLLQMVSLLKRSWACG